MKTMDAQIGKEKLSSTENKTMTNIPFTISVSILALVLAVSTFFFFANRSTVSEIDQTKKIGMEYDTSIAKLKGNRNIAAAESVQNTQAELIRNIRMSEAQKYITELQNISKTFKINFSGFSYQNGKVLTSATAESENTIPLEDAITKVSSFVKFYRTASGNIFDLSPVSTISGQEQKRSFPIEFSVNTASMK